MKAKEAASHDEEIRFVDCPVSVFDVEKRKLTAIYQFALAMPELIVPASHVRVDKKRKRGKYFHFYIISILSHKPSKCMCRHYILYLIF